MAGSIFFDTRAAVQAARRARHDAASLAAPVSSSATTPATTLREEQGFSAVASSLLHVALLAVLIWSTSGAVEMAATTPRDRLVFLGGTRTGRGRWRWRKGPESARQSNREAQTNRSPIARSRAGATAFKSPYRTGGDRGRATQSLRHRKLTVQAQGSEPGVDDGTGGGVGRRSVQARERY